MRTNIELDDRLVSEAFRLTGIKTKRELIHEALRILVENLRRKNLSDLRGKIQFAADYDYKTARARKS